LERSGSGLGSGLAKLIGLVSGLAKMVPNRTEPNFPNTIAKGSKSIFYMKMAKYVFSVDADPKVRIKVKEDMKKYSKVVENQITQ
jgi:hypothetical protein